MVSQVECLVLGESCQGLEVFTQELEVTELVQKLPNMVQEAQVCSQVLGVQVFTQEEAQACTQEEAQA